MANVLIVDDFQTQRMVVKSYLDGLGYSIYEAVNGKDALEKIKFAKFDVILTDYEMPEMDGMELTKTLRSMPGYANTPIIMVTSVFESQSKAKWAGVTEWMHKPFDKSALVHRVKSLLAGPEQKKTKREVVLLSEDENNKRSLSTLLSSSGVVVHVKSTMQEAWIGLKLIAADALIVDLPYTNGEIERLLSKVDEVPQLDHVTRIILHGIDDYPMHLKQLADHFVRKPVTPTVLVSHLYK